MRLSAICVHASLTLLFALVWPLAASGQGALTEMVDAPHGASPVMAARRQAIDTRAFQRPLDEPRIRKWLELTSRTTVAEFELFASPLSPVEEKLLAKMRPMAPPIVNRLPLANLRGVLAGGGLLSLGAEQRLKKQAVRHTTPGVEELLYDAYECVFASVGPPDGTLRYGDTIIRLADSVREHGWATPFSGMYFVGHVRHKDASGMLDLLKAGKPLSTTRGNSLHLGFDDRLHFSHYIVTEKEWGAALAWQAVLVQRNLKDNEPDRQVGRRFEEMLERDGREFWTQFIPAEIASLSEAERAARVPFGYLEGKFPDRVSIENFTSIEVPADRLAEVRAWPEARPYLKLIKAKAAGVR